MVSQSMQTKPLAPLKNPEQVNAILSAIGELSQEDLQRLGGWDPLEEISSATIFDGVEGAPTGVFETPNGDFIVSGTVYVTLQYGSSREGISMSDSYPALIRGNFDTSGRPEFSAIEVDNTSFYE